MSSEISPKRAAPEVGRLAGCLWLVLGGFSLLFILSAGGVGIDATFALGPIVVIPVVLAIFVFVRGRTQSALFTSALAGIAFAAIGTWNYFRAAAFEEANPGSMEVSGHGVSVAFALLSALTATWSIAAAWLVHVRARRS